jgi:predicted anti-sigma-YlaC factor YlaD
MLNLVPRSDCLQAREAVSARLDCELPELDAARLDVHLRGCPDCRTYAHEIEKITAGLRATPLERPEIQLIVPRRRIPASAVAVAAAAMLLTAIAGSSFALGRASFAGHGGSDRTVTGFTYLGIHADAKEEHLLAQLRGVEQAPLGRHGRPMTV